MVRPLCTDLRVLHLEDEAVRAIHRACHPTWPERPAHWYEAHPTLVLQVDGEIIGYTSYALVMQPEVSLEGEVMIGYGIDVKPSHQGKGYGHDLCAARMTVARAVGARVFVGHAAPGNAAMIRLFEHDGLKPYGAAPAAYPDGTTMLIYMGPVS